MKRNPTKSEALFKEKLNKSGIEYKTQIIVGFYIVDFIIPDRMICIEIDGSSHNGKELYDARRDEFLDKVGYKVIHIQNEDVENFNIQSLIEYPTFYEFVFRHSLSKANVYRCQAIRKEKFKIKPHNYAFLASKSKYCKEWYKFLNDLQN